TTRRRFTIAALCRLTPKILTRSAITLPSCTRLARLTTRLRIIIGAPWRRIRRALVKWQTILDSSWREVGTPKASDYWKKPCGFLKPQGRAAILQRAGSTRLLTGRRRHAT